MVPSSWSGFRKPAVSIPRCVALGCLVSGWVWISAAIAGSEASAENGTFQLELPPEPFVPAVPRTTADQRQLEALAWFASARAAQHREQYEKALRLYQRAFRYDPQSVSIVRAIVPLAVRLQRPAEAVRYALRSAELDDADPVLLRRLGIYLTEQGEWEQAAALYERALPAGDGAKETAADILVRMELARLHHLMERHEQATDHFAKVLDALERPANFGLDEETIQVLLGEPGLTYALFGESFLRAGRLDEAKAAWQKAHELDPDRGRLELRRARVFLQSGRPEEAYAALQAAFEHDLDAENATPYRLLIEVLERLDRRDEIVPRLEALRENQDNGAAVAHVLAEHYMEHGKLHEAVVLYEQLLEQSPTLATFRALAEAYRRRGMAEPLLRVAGTLAERTGSLDALGAELEKIAASEELLEKLIETARQRRLEAEDGLDHGRALAAAMLAMEGGRAEAAGEMFEAALAARPERAAELLTAWGMGLLLKNEPGRAVEVFRRAIDQDVQPKSNPLFHFYLAGALELAGRTDEALDAARKAAELQPDSPRIQQRAGWVLYHAGRYAEAIEAYRGVIERFDGDHASPDTRDALRHGRLVLSSLHVLQGDYAGAETWLEEVLDEFPDDPGALNDLGYLWADQNKNLDLALDMIERAVAAQPDNAAYRDSLGWVYYRLGRYDEAVVELEKAAGLEEDPVILDHLGDAYAAVGRIDKARNAWRRGAEAFREAGEQDKAIEVEDKLVPEGDGPDGRETPDVESGASEPVSTTMGQFLSST